MGGTKEEKQETEDERRGEERPLGESALGSRVTDEEVVWGKPKKERMKA